MNQEDTMNHKSNFILAPSTTGPGTMLHGILPEMPTNMYIGAYPAHAYGQAATDDGIYAPKFT